MQDPLESFIAKLLREKGKPETAESRTQLLAAVNNAIDQALIEALPLKQLDKLEAATNENRVDDALLEQLLSEAGIKSDEIINKTLEKFQDEYLKGAK